MVSVLSIERPQTSRFLLTRTEKRTLTDMKSMKVTEARKQLYRLLAEVTLSSDPVQITGKRGNAVLLSEDDWLALQGTVHLLLSVSGFAERVAERVEKRITDLRQRYEACQQEKMNHRLAVLTVLSAIFLPLTLVAGIWGMNFERMPELAFPWSYPAALGLMACISGGMLLFFHRKGWFK